MMIMIKAKITNPPNSLSQATKLLACIQKRLVRISAATPGILTEAFNVIPQSLQEYPGIVASNRKRRFTSAVRLIVNYHTVTQRSHTKDGTWFTLKMKAVISSEILAPTYQSIDWHIP